MHLEQGPDWILVEEDCLRDMVIMSSASRFVPLSQVDTVEDVPSTVASTIALTEGAASENIRPTVHESDTETMPSVGGSPEDSEDDGHSNVEDHPILGEVDVGFEEIGQSSHTRSIHKS